MRLRFGEPSHVGDRHVGTMLNLIVVVRAVVSHEKLIGPWHIGESHLNATPRGTIGIIESSGTYILVATVGEDVAHELAPHLVVVVGVVVERGEVKGKACSFVTVSTIEVCLIGVERAVGERCRETVAHILL